MDPQISYPTVPSPPPQPMTVVSLPPPIPAISGNDPHIGVSLQFQNQFNSVSQGNGMSGGMFQSPCVGSPGSSPVKEEILACKRERRLEKNREAARMCRKKKKEYVKCLEDRVRLLEQQNLALITELKKLKTLVAPPPPLAHPPPTPITTSNSAESRGPASALYQVI